MKSAAEYPGQGVGFRSWISRCWRVEILCLGAFLAVGVEGEPGIAQARLFCRSVSVQPGSTSFGSTLQFSSIGFGPFGNGELAPLDMTGLPSHFSGFKLADIIASETVYGQLALDVPFQDLNDDGYIDFFEVSEGIQASTAGQYYVEGVDSGTIAANWNRAAGSAEGTCTFRLVSSVLGALGDFQHRFRILEYAGSLNYLARSNTVTGDLDVRRREDPNLRWVGPVEFEKSQGADRFDELGFLGGTWTNETGGLLVYAQTWLDRYLPYSTNYYAFIDFQDGDLNTTADDYWSWVLSVDDSNDRDSDGIPDLSDDPAAHPAPVLGIQTEGTGFELTIHGTIGFDYRIESSMSLEGAWQAVQSLTLTNSTQSLALTNLTEARSFWRALEL